MSRRDNWQLGREMEYPYEPSPPERQVAYVFDTNKCIECQTCTVACKTCWTSGKGQETIFWNNVETKPYGGYPMAWDLRLLEKTGPAEWADGTLQSPTIFETEGNKLPPNGHRPEVADYSAPNLGEDDITGLVELGTHFAGVHPMWMFYLARICNHCDNPACLAACPRKAIYKRNEDGIVLVDQSRCRGYQECIRSCPYKKVFYNMVSRISEKCIGCFPRVEQGEVALCVESCIGKIRLHGFLSTREEPRADNPLDYIIKIRKIALPLYPQHGTGPNVYYIPPVHVPTKFLEQLFGPGVEEAKDMYRNLDRDPQLLGALLLSGASNRIITRFAVEDETVLGWDDAGTELARVPFTEQSYVRPAYDETHEVYRHNTN
ncbi:MAG: dehydrogenase [Candidatus Eisenbacteria bacterium]|uniref:Dehydrogenase n=1 Tax=Eiseniibacteriota bacterium TaxID=2212470 RepID=A0A956NEU6_UNCEI|nr:dehydrogenase [Candidatus Eisenbacteria bacterium]